MTEVAHKYGGLIEFYRSSARVAWTPTGTNVPDYPALADLWWKNIALASNDKLQMELKNMYGDGTVEGILKRYR